MSTGRRKTEQLYGPKKLAKHSNQRYSSFKFIAFRCSTLLISAMAFTGQAQVPVFDWVRSAGGSGYDSCRDVVASSDGSIYVTGEFSGSVDFDGPGINGQGGELTSVNYSDLFVARYQSNGTLLWVRSADGADGYGISAIDDGGVYVTGSFGGSIDFDGPGINGQGGELTSMGSADLFVARYQSNGTLLWVRSAGGTDSDVGLDITAGNDGSASVTGYFHESADFDGPNINGQGGEVTSMGSADIFVARYDSNGTLLWVRSAGGNNAPPDEQEFGDSGHGITAASDGSVYVIGDFLNAADFDGLGVNGQGGEVSGQWYDVFVARYDSTGALLWVRSINGSGGNSGLGIATASDGSFYVTGIFFATTDFDGPNANGLGGEITSLANSADIFLARYDGNGILLWVQGAGGNNWDESIGLATSSNGSVYVTGLFEAAADFDGSGTTGQGGEVTGTGPDDIFLARYNSDGSLIWVHSAGGVGHDHSYGVAASNDGSIYVTGYFEATADFDGPANGQGGEVTSMGKHDFFLARYTEGPSIEEIPIPTLVCWPCLPLGDPFTIYVRDIIERIIDVDDRSLPISDVLITSVTSDEPELSAYDKTRRDIIIASDCRSVQLTTEANLRGNGRVYTLNMEIIDARGNIGTASHQVHMTHHRGIPAIVDRPAYTVDGCNLGKRNVEVQRVYEFQNRLLEQSSF